MARRADQPDSDRPQLRSIREPGVLVFRLLGPVVVEGPHGDLSVGGPRARAVLAALLVDHDRWVGTELLADMAFGGPASPVARNSIQSHVSRLRKLLRPHGIEFQARRHHYRMSLAASVLDLDRFRELAGLGAQAMDGRPAEAVHWLREALAWWRGPALADLAELPRLDIRANGLDEERRRVTEQLFEAELAVGNHATIVVELREATRRYPYQERLHAQLMRALYGAGRQVEALNVLRDLEATLAEDLGISPSPELRELERRVVSHDRSLSVVGPVPAPTPSRAARSRSPDMADLLPFVGRRHELGRLMELADRSTRDHRSAVVVVEGEAGIGKSRLVDEAVARSGAAALTGGCSRDLGIPYEPLTDILAALDRNTTSVAVIDALEQLGDDLAPLLPGSRAREKPDALTNLGDPALARYRLLAGLRAVLASALGEAGGLLVTEDVQWTTPTTVAALRFLTLKQPVPGCVVVLTMRPFDASHLPELSALLADLHRTGALDRIVLEPLEDEFLAEILAPRTEADDLPAAVRQLRDHTGGLPLLVDIALSQGPRPADEGAVVAPSREITGRDRTEATVQGFVADCTAHLGPEARLVLARSAVLGNAIDVAVLDELGTKRSIDELDHLRRAGILREIAADRFVFAHELTRAAVLAGLGPSRLARLHGEAATAIEAVHGVSASTIDRLAVHRLAAVRGGMDLAAAGAARRAAQLALARVALHDAQRWARAGLGLLPVDDAPADLEVDLCLVLAEAAFGLGDHAGSRDLATSAARAAHALDDPQRRARAAIARAATWSPGDEPDALLLLTDAWGRLGDADVVLQVRVLATLAAVATATAVAGAASPPSLAPPAELADEAVRLARRAHATESRDSTATGRTAATDALALALASAVLTRHGSPRVDEQIRAADEIDVLAQRYDDHYLAAHAARIRALPRLLRGDREGFETDAHAVAAFAEQADLHEHRVETEQWRALLALLDGRLDDVEEPSARAVELSHGDRHVTTSHRTRMLWLAREQDRLDGAAEVLAALAEAHPTVAGYRAHLALTAADTGQLALARRQLDRLGRTQFAELARDVTWVGSAAALVEAAAVVGDRDRAATLAGRLEPYAGQLVSAGPGVLCMGAVDRYRALAAGLLEDPAADRLFAAALDVERAVASPPLQAWTWYWWGVLSRLRDPRTARRRLLAASETARSYGGALLARRVEQALASL